MKQIHLSKDEQDDLEAWLNDDENEHSARLGKLLANSKVLGEYDD